MPLDAILPRPPMPDRARTQVESFLVLRRNPLELWGPMAYEEWVLPGSFLGRGQVFLNDPAAIRHVLVTNAANYVRNRGTKRILAPILGEGLFLAEGESWKAARRTIAPALAPRAMPVMARHIAAETAAHEPELDAASRRPVELMRFLQRLTLAIAGRTMFSLETAAFGAELRTLLERYATLYAKPGLLDLLLPESVPSPLDLGRRRFRGEWLAFMDRILAAREGAAPWDEAAGAPRDLLDLLRAARDPETGGGFTRDRLRDEVSTLLLAGHETTAVSLFWSLLAAARLPEWQEELAEEARAADLSPDGAAAAADALPKLRAHLDEALRLYPPAFLIVREAVAEDEIPVTARHGGASTHRVAPGTVVSVSPWVLHRHRGLWRDPDAFDASRFLPGAPAVDRFAYLPFGAGPRICVGARFATTEAVIVLARLLRRYRIEPFGGDRVVPLGLVTTQPDRPVRFVVTRRAGVSP